MEPVLWARTIAATRTYVTCMARDHHLSFCRYCCGQRLPFRTEDGRAAIGEGWLGVGPSSANSVINRAFNWLQHFSALTRVQQECPLAVRRPATGGTSGA